MPSGQGFWILTYGGPVRAAAGLVGLTASERIPPPMPSGQGYWILTCGGPVRAAAGLVGLTASERIPPPMPSGQGFWILTYGGPVRVAAGLVGVYTADWGRGRSHGSTIISGYQRYKNTALDCRIDVLTGL